MEGVKEALGSRGMTDEAARLCARQEQVESPGTYVDDRVSRGHFCVVLVVLRTALQCSGGLYT